MDTRGPALDLRCHDGQKTVFDSGFIRHLAEQAFNLRSDHDYFQSADPHLDRVPARTSDRPRIFFSNHSGMAFPWDAIVFNTLYWEKRGFAQKDLLRPLIAPHAFAEQDDVSLHDRQSVGTRRMRRAWRTLNISCTKVRT